jgi:hypothetical protein
VKVFGGVCKLMAFASAESMRMLAVAVVAGASPSARPRASVMSTRAERRKRRHSLWRRTLSG